MASTYQPTPNLELSQRPYQCACQKTYKSYPALYTHIKNKHDGKAPGIIKKPTHKKGKSPESSVNHSKASIQTQYLSSKSQVSIQLTQNDYSYFQAPRLTQEDCITNIAIILAQLPQQAISKERLHEIMAIIQMTVFMATKKTLEEKKSVGAVLKQFFQMLTGRVQWSKFKQFYTLLMIFSQFILKKIGNKLFFQVQEPDIFCHFINEFVQHQMEMMINQYKLENLLIFQRRTTLQLFFWFFQWMLLKEYTTYKVSFKQDIGKDFIY